MRNFIRKIWNDLFGLFHPDLCLLCERRLVDGEEQVCERCVSRLAYTCFRVQTDFPGNPVESLLVGYRKLVAATAYLHFEQGGHVRQLVHSFKYHGNKKLAFWMGRQAALALLAEESPLCRVALLHPVPLHPRKQRKRGYNQSEWIARGMASVWQTPVYVSAIRRDVMNKSQTSQQGYQRWENVKDIFSVSMPDILKGKHILLVDDVITSGATAGACIDAMSQIEDIEISFFSLTIAPQ